MIKSLNHFSFTVDNLDKSIKFYTEVLGLKYTNRMRQAGQFIENITGVAGVEIDIAYFEQSGFQLALVEYVKSKGVKIDTNPSNTGSAHVCFNVGDFDKFIKKLKSNGVVFAGPVSVIPQGPNKGKKAVYIKDLDDNIIELFSEK